MSLLERITTDMKAALKAGEKDRLGLLRMLIANLKNEADANGPLDEAQELAVLRRAAKSRREAAEAAQNAQRMDRAEAELAEAAWIDAYLPAQLDAAAIEAKARELIAELGIESPKDRGRFMKEWMARYRDVSDGKLVSEVVGRLLA